MDGARLFRFPHLSWLRFGIECVERPRQSVVSLNGLYHTLGLVRRGRHDVRWITRGAGRCWTSSAGSVFFLPADGEHHTFITRQIPDFRFHTPVMPRLHLEDLLRSEYHEPRFTWQHSLNPSDGVLQSCIAGVFDGLDDDKHDAMRADEAARRLVLRLAELSGGGTPDSHDDASVFDRRRLLGLVAFIDEHRREAPTPAELGSWIGLSPSHFAKKFRQSTGLSLHRFIQRRRIQRALELMKTDVSDSLAHDSLLLGFSSQSHFTRLFSDLTGMTPAKYRRQVRPVVG